MENYAPGGTKAIVVMKLLPTA